MRFPNICPKLPPALRHYLVLVLLTGASSAVLACPATPGATCDAGGDAPASQPLGVGVNLGAGNPINVINGNKYQREEDMPALPGVMGLEIVRHYNSSLSGTGDWTGRVGRGWRLSYETRLIASANSIQIEQADGARLLFSRDALRPTVATPDDPAHGAITTRRSAQGEEYVWRWADGRELSFNQRGQLMQIKAATGEITSLMYDPKGPLVRVTDPQGRSMSLSYLDHQSAAKGDRFRGVQSIQTPVGRFSYEYGSAAPQGLTLDKRYLLANLVRVRYPVAGQGRQYHYEDAAHPTYMTGISIESAGADGKPKVVRYATFGYNAAGKGILSTHANDVDKVTLDFEKNGVTTITNSLGQKTTYRYAGAESNYRLVEVRGAGCALCGPANQRYRYDQQGRLLETDLLDAQGVVVQTQKAELDPRGRPLLVSRIDYVNGKAQPVQWLGRYEYTAGAVGATLIARPSVVAGKEAVTRIAYNGMGQPSSVTFSGWSPQPEGMGAAVAIGGTTRYDYRVINGLSVLAQIDGPLLNGKTNSPADSDITRLEYEADGRMVARTIAPGGVVTEVRERDAALRAVTVRRSDGAVEQTATNRLDWQGRTEVGSVEAARVNATSEGQPTIDPDSKQIRTLHYTYDAFGNLTGVTQPGNLTTGFTYDDAGRATARVLPDGSRVEQARDTEDRKTDVPSPTGVERDPWGRAIAWRDADGVQLLQAQWGAMGTAAQGAVLALRTRNAHAERLVDDAGRVVAIRNPGQGWQRARYDAAGRVEESTDPRGARQRATWDSASRLVQLERFAPGGRVAEQVLSYRYAGAWAAEETITDADGTRTILTERDARGRVLRETLRISGAGTLAQVLAQPVQISQAYRYDAQGRVLARTLIDNTGRKLELETTLDQQGLPSRIAAVGALPAWLGGRQAVIDRIEWQRLGSTPWATEIAHSDGSVDRYARVDGGVAPDQNRAAPAGQSAPEEMAAEAEAAVPVRSEERAARLTSAKEQRQEVDRAPPAQDLASTTAPAGENAATDKDQDHAPPTGPGSMPDVAGLPTAVRTAQGEQALRWNAAGQLSATRRTAGESRYVYDARGRRVVKLVTDTKGATQVALSVYEGYSLLAEADAHGRASFAYVHLGWRPVAQIDLRDDSWWQTMRARLFGLAARQLHTNRAGKVLSMTQGGKPVWQDQPSQGAGAAHQPLRYVGQYHDDDSGLDYHGARYFEAGSGRFISPDPQGMTDAVNELPANLLLDLYAYAGGQPDDYFDPDGAARIRYYAITTDAKGKELGTNQGFTKARWAFIVDNIKEGGDKSALGQKRNEYAQNGTGLLVDAKGDFLDGKNSATTWTGGSSDVPGEFTEHYGNNLIQVPEFTIDNMSDDDATKLIASYIAADKKALFPNSCPNNSTLLPPIKFGEGDADINVMQANANGANKQRILACGAGSNADITLRRIAKYEAAAEGNETGKINRDCSAGGCPGIAYYCDETKCDARDQLTFGPPKNDEPVYTPSYGRSQFIGSTLVGELRAAYHSFSADDLKKLLLTPEMQQPLQDAADRATKMESWWKATPSASSYAAASQAWKSLSAVKQTEFIEQTGLGERAYVDMVRIKTKPPVSTAGTDLSADAKQALVTSAIFSDSIVKDFLMGIFEDFDQFTLMSHALMRKNLSNAIKYRPNASEQYLAAMIARAHNGGNWQRTYEDLTSHDQLKYVNKFIGTAGHTGDGDWKSLRCTESLGDDTVKPGTQGSGIGGLEFKPLQ